MACERKIGPFDCCSVVQGDCLELLKDLPSERLVCECGESLDLVGNRREGGLFHAVAGHKQRSVRSIDAVITDPPYGISFDTDFRRFTDGKGRPKSTVVYPPVFGDDKPFDHSPWLNFPVVVMFGANHFADKLPTGTWLVWDKRYPNGFAWLCDGEAAWMSRGKGLYICSVTNQGNVRPEPSQHPTQKPVEVMQWCIEKSGNPETILDPYCGSGSTLVAAKKLGRHFLGFEISAEYCQIARDRLARIDAQPKLFETRPEQMALA